MGSLFYSLLLTRLDNLEPSQITSSKENQTDNFQNEEEVVERSYRVLRWKMCCAYFRDVIFKSIRRWENS